MKNGKILALFGLLAQAGVILADGDCPGPKPMATMVTPSITLIAQPQPPCPPCAPGVSFPTPPLFLGTVQPSQLLPPAPPPPPVTLMCARPPGVTLIQGQPPRVDLVWQQIQPPQIMPPMPPLPPVTLYRAAPVPSSMQAPITIPGVGLYYQPQPPCPLPPANCCPNRCCTMPAAVSGNHP